MQSNFSYCTACITLYGAYLGSCLTCNSSFCETCSSNIFICTSCINGYGLNTNGTCMPCQTSSSLCLNCDGANLNQCVSCNQGYFFVGGICRPCTTTCISCSNATTCNSCIDGYYLDSANIC